MEKLGRYKLIRKLGEGASATIYLAEDDFADRQVAIKMFRPETLLDPERGKLYRRLLLNEASLAGKLIHPHIVQIFDAVISADLSYIVMEYVPGGTLAQFCTPDKLLPLERLVQIIFKCTRALDYAFRMGITHRDIKPANILLAGTSDDASSGDIKISDFGTAVQAANQTRTEVSGIGSPAYMSPEQVEELPVDHRTDIYSLGVVMYQLLTGRLPFQANSQAGMIYQIVNGVPPQPATLRSDLPPALAAVAMRAMSKVATDRYPDWASFSHDLAQVYRHDLLAARRQGFADSERFEILRSIAFFKSFSDVELWEVARIARWDEIGPDTVIMRDGEAGDSFSLVIEGELLVSKRGRTLGRLEPGDCFGEMAVIDTDQHLRGADVVARKAAKLITVSGEALRSASETCRMHFYRSFLDVLAARLRQANVRLAAN
jgi:serine/threonine protein kinase